MNEFDYLKLTKEGFNKLGEYLAEFPYKYSAQIIELLNKEVTPMKDPTGESSDDQENKNEK